MTAGPMTIVAMAKELDVKTDSVEKALKRNRGRFICLPGTDGIDRWGLIETRPA
jgi:hypothetical protein